ncbi:MAG: DUF58 domain-containing protein [Parachlamydiaceae bacterium]|nr:DUF58 domain-containing protein [Parachlamydiaceae bacterium]
MPISISEAFQHIRRIQIKTSRNVDSLFVGAYRSAFKGTGLEFEGVREYQIGDDIDKIDWHLTARMQKPYIKTFQEERQLTVMLVVDVSASSQFGSSDRLKSEIIAEIGATLAFSAIKNHDKVGLLLFSNEIELYLAPKNNLRHVLRVIRELLFFKPKHKGTDIKKALSFLGRVQKRHAICFLISDFLTTDYAHDVFLISKRHDLILMDIYDEYEKQFPRIGLANIADLETGQMECIDTSGKQIQESFNDKANQRILFLKTLSNKTRTDLISIRSNQSYTDALHRFFKVRRQRH